MDVVDERMRESMDVVDERMRESMDFMDVVEIVSAVLRRLRAEPYRDSFFIKVIKEVEKIIKELKNVHTHDDELKEPLENLLDLVYAMEDFAETRTLSRWQHFRRMGFGRRYIFFLRGLKLKAKVDACLKKSSGIRRSLPPKASYVVGLEKDKTESVKWLTDTKSSPILGFLLISGQTGSGKTVLATEIYNSCEIKKHFTSRAWVSASEDPVSNFRSILQQIAGNSTVDEKSTVRELEEEICKIFQTKQCLLVVDNVQSPFLFKTISDIVNSGTHSQPADGAIASRVIMTMRSKNDLWSRENKDKFHVEQSQMKAESSYSASKSLVDRFMNDYRSLSSHRMLQPLQGDDAWNLFSKMVGSERLPDGAQQNPSLDELRSTILAISQCIPSAIVVLGSFLQTKKSYQEWWAVLKNESIEGNKDSISKILAVMNSDLTFGLRPCLFYFLLFKREIEIPVRRLLLLWVAEGLIVTENPNPEETAERILTYFTIKGMIEIGSWRKDGSPKTCRMPGILHDICLSKAKNIFGLLPIHPKPDSGSSSSSDHASPSPPRKFDVRRVAEHGDIIKMYSHKQSDFPHLRSYLSFNTRNEDTPAVEIGNFFKEGIGHRCFGLLRVLDLERVYKPKLPDNLGKLYHLRYLGLRWTFLDTLPHSVGELSYLETLDMKHTYISSPPNSIWKMKHLRHLWLNEIRLEVKKHSISDDSKLQTLWGLFVDSKNPVQNGLDKLTALKKLGLTIHFKSEEESEEQWPVLNKWIANQKKLQSLRLRSKVKNGGPSSLKTLKPLSGQENLTNLYLLGQLPELDYNYFPKTLAVLTLSVSKLKKDPMPTLAMLPNLSVLGLLADSYDGEQLSCPRAGFSKLRILKLWMLRKLVTWTVKEQVMQNLCELEIRCCHKLTELPHELLSKIDKIILTNMQEKFVDNIKANISEGKLKTSSLPVRCESRDCTSHDAVKQV